MRRLIGLLVLGLAALSPMNRAASLNASPVVQVDDGSLYRGANPQGQVTVRLANASTVGSLRFKMTLSEGLSVSDPLESQPGTLFNGPQDQFQTHVTGQTVDVVLVSSGPVVGPGTLFSFKVSASPTAPSPAAITIDKATVQAVDPTSNDFITVGDPVNGVITLLPPLDVTVGAANGFAGGSVRIPVSLTASTVLGGARVRLTTPAGGLKFTGIDATGSILVTGPSDVSQANVSNNGAQVDVALVSNASHTGPGLLFTLTADLPAGAAPGTSFPVTIVGTPTTPETSGVTPDNATVIPAGTLIAGAVTTLNPLDVTVGTAPGAPGQIVRVPVSLASPTVLGAVRVRLTLDAGGAKFTGIDTAGSVFVTSPQDVAHGEVTNNGLQLDAALVSNSARTGPGLLFNALVQLPADAPLGQMIAVNVVGTPTTPETSGVAPDNTTIVPAGALVAGKITLPSVSVRSANVKPGEATTLHVYLNDADSVGGLDLTFTLSNPALASLVAGSGAAGPGAPGSTVTAEDIGGGKIRLAVVSTKQLASGEIAQFQVSGGAAILPYQSSLLTITDAKAVSADNNSVGGIGVAPNSTAILIAGKWVVDIGAASKSAPTIGTVGGKEIAYFGYMNGQLHAHMATDGTPGFGATHMVQLGIGPLIRRPTFRAMDDATAFLYVASSTGSVAKVKATDGSIVWTTTLTGGRIPTTSPSVGSDATSTSVYVGTAEGFLVKLNDTDGAQVAEFNAGAPISADPAVGPAAANALEVWVGAGNKVFQLDGALQPKKDMTTGGPVASPPFISPALRDKDNAITRLITSASQDGKLYVFNSGTGINIGTYDSKAPIQAATYVDWAGGTNPNVAYLVNTLGELHTVALQNVDVTTAGQTLAGQSIGTGPANANTAVILTGTPRFAYFSAPGGFAGLKLGDTFSSPTTATITVGTPYPAYSPAAAVGADTLVVTLANGATLALGLLPEGTVGQ